MRFISVRQPWAWLIVQGHKHIENRDRSTSYRGPLGIHAGQTCARKYYDEVAEQLALQFGSRAPVLPAYDQLQRGGIVGRVRLVDVVTTSDSAWFTGEFGWVLLNAQPLPFVPWKGQLGFFDVPRHALNLAEATQ